MTWDVEYWLDTADETQNLASFLLGRVSDRCTLGHILYLKWYASQYRLFSLGDSITIVKQSFFPPPPIQ